MIQTGNRVFPQVVNTLKPDCVLILSGGAWDWWIQGLTDTAPLMVDGDEHACCEFSRDDNRTSLCTWTYHPAKFGFGDAVNYHPIVSALLGH